MTLSAIDVSRSTRLANKRGRKIASFWVLDETSRTVALPPTTRSDNSPAENAVCLYRVADGVPELVDRISQQVQTDPASKPPSRARLAFDLLSRARVRKG